MAGYYGQKSSPAIFVPSVSGGKLSASKAKKKCNAAADMKLEGSKSSACLAIQSF